eukprot:TRINITY_DN4327_c0_g1_i1.p1 TRINITY_DN4327_c0_g1~~TRINITY_DN4327_c0_g1_i1.p1  ORF type:complete len:214 (+),score=68.93 TRINITY_DN4327_c0_g1_i1:28-669(+)
MSGEEENSIKKSKVYTRTGDGGTSSLFNLERRSKDDIIFDALGTVDELNAYIGLTREYVQQNSELKTIDQLLEEVQCRLFDIAGAVATPLQSSKPELLERVAFAEENIAQLEKWIDFYDSQLPPLKNFILPSGGKSACHIHVCRTICRRAERSVTPLFTAGQVSKSTSSFLNRLSDFLFVIARYVAMKEGKEEKLYKQGAGLFSAGPKAKDQN